MIRFVCAGERHSAALGEEILRDGSVALVLSCAGERHSGALGEEILRDGSVALVSMERIREGLGGLDSSTSVSES